MTVLGTNAFGVVAESGCAPRGLDFVGAGILSPERRFVTSLGGFRLRGRPRCPSIFVPRSTRGHLGLRTANFTRLISWRVKPRGKLRRIASLPDDPVARRSHDDVLDLWQLMAKGNNELGWICSNRLVSREG
jgi:hypothetical protein